LEDVGDTSTIHAANVAVVEYSRLLKNGI
jgi:hypothetical protein